MLLLILGWMACNSTTAPVTHEGTDPNPRPDRPAVDEEPVSIPAGSAVTRDCWGRDKDLANQRGRGGWAPGSPTPAAPMKPTPKPKTSTRSSGAIGSGGGFGILGSKGDASAEGAPSAAMPLPAAAPTMDAAPPPPMAEPTTAATATPMAEAESASAPLDAVVQGGAVTGNTASLDDGADRAAAPLARAEASKSEEKAREQIQQKRRPAQPKRVAPPQPTIDWGATTWLSNDDSMSLASAQRLLYDVKEHVDFRPSEVRPHELLNYFSFDTSPVGEGRNFSVLASAEQTGPDTLTLALAVQGAKPRPQPLDLTVVVDVSGSMEAEGRMAYVKRGLNKMSEQLRRGDRLDLVIFDDQVCTPLENYVVGRDAPSLLTDAIAQLEPRGSTDLDLGLKEGYRLANAWVDQDSAHKRNHRVMVLTDALLNTGDINTDTVSEVARAYETRGVRLTGVGVGRDFNDAALDKLTEKGKGAYVYLGSEAVVDRVMGVGFQSLTQTIAHDVRFALDLPDSLGLVKFYGEESSTDPEDIQPIHYYAGTSQVFLQDLKVRDGRLVSSDDLKMEIHYQDPITGAARTETWTGGVGEVLGMDKHNVRKARALMGWTDFALARAMHGTPCGEPLSTYRERAAQVGDDAEIAYLNGLTGPLCGVELGTTLSTPGVAWRVKVDSDVPIAEVVLSCPTGSQTEALAAGDTVARFNATPGACSVTLQGAVPMVAKVQVPVTGGDTRCVVRGGRVSCS